MTYPPAFWLLLGTGTLGAALLVYERVTRTVPRRFVAFSWAIGAVLVWIVPYAFELALTDRGLMLLVANIQFIGIGAAPVMIYEGVRQFVGRPLHGPGRIAAALAVPAIAVLLAFTDPLHGLFRTSADVVTANGMVQLDVTYGFFHDFLFVPYQYGFYFATLYTLVDTAMRSSSRFRARLLLFALAMAIPLIGGTLYVVGVEPFDVFNPAPALFLVSFLMVGAAMLRHHVMDLVPVARDLVLDTLREAVIVLDTRGRVVDFNAAAARMFPALTEHVIGEELPGPLAANDALLALARGVETTDAAFYLPTPFGNRECVGQSSEVRGVDGSLIGRVVTVLDVTGMTISASAAGTLIEVE